MSPKPTTPAPAPQFVHTPRPPQEIGTHDDYTTYGPLWTASEDHKNAFSLCSFSTPPGKVRLTLEALHSAEARFYLPADLLLPLARALIDAHHHLTQGPQHEAHPNHSDGS